ncbi:MAG: DNA polymerase IV [Planctomycetota bacterium]
MTSSETLPRKVIHVDMDAFFAAVEQRDRPELRGKPVIVGGSPHGRGVVSTASYEARRFGVHSAMPCSRAFRLCPQGIFLRPRFEAYRAVSDVVRAIFHDHTDLVEPVSLDEAYLDVTRNRHEIPSATGVAERIRREIFEQTSLTASAGVGPNKFIAKVASDMNKPDGLTVVPPGQVREFLEHLPVKKIPGIGPVTGRRCEEFGIRSCGDFLRFDETELQRLFGKSGRHFLLLARGLDPRPVVADSERKSVSIEDTFPEDLKSLDDALVALDKLANGLEGRLEKHGFSGRTVVLKVKYGDFRQITRQRSLGIAVRSRKSLLATAMELLPETEVGRRPVRLLGLGVSHLLDDREARQQLFSFAREQGLNG